MQNESNIYHTIMDIVEHWRLKGLFEDVRVEQVMDILKTNMLPDGSMVGHTPRWTCVIDDNGFSCSCPDYQYRFTKCKHLGALATKIKRDWDKEFGNEEN
jgi:hypothetical protein